MTSKEIIQLRLVNQRLGSKKSNKPNQVVEWMGAMQAQDFSMAKWAIGIRLKNSSISSIEKSLEKNEIIRTHVLRPTWHLVSSNDIYWMLRLTAPNIKAAATTRWKQLELGDTILKKCKKIIERALIKEKKLSRDQIKNLLQ